MSTLIFLQMAMQSSHQQKNFLLFYNNDLIYSSNISYCYSDIPENLYLFISQSNEAVHKQTDGLISLMK